MTLIAILFPGLSFLLRGKIFSALVALVLQIVACFLLLFGVGFFLWAVLAFWAVNSYNHAKADRRNRDMVRMLSRSRDIR